MDRVYRIYIRMHNSKLKVVRKFYHVWLRIVYSCDIMPQTEIGIGTRFAHNGLGVVINEDAVIGENCVIGKGVVIGGRSGISIVPKIGNNVEIGANSVVIGPIKVGDNAQIGAGSVVVHNVDPCTVVVGNPAKAIKTINREKKE